uniref:Uncharacterized protein n=1 Tax=Pseudomonas syringae pv. actinidiae TaxID=103796 RepID=A0A2P0QI67_PSESF|nr:hypothetical protein [Pseudomonas syringae]ARO45270.1 hypothetical protein [Pseudomonas syringae pv. actinidiae]
MCIQISAENLTFDSVCAAYALLLENNPGLALMLSDGGAVFLENGNIYSVAISDSGVLLIDTAGCIYPSAWDQERRCWDSEEGTDACVSAINNPTFINYANAIGADT